VVVRNITARGVDERLRRAVLGVGLVLAVLVAMASHQAPAWSYALLFVPLFLVANVAYQGLFKT
jgi:hypothetical protein